MHISKRLALAISGTAFAGAAALGLGVAAPAGAAVSAPTQGVASHIFCGGGFSSCGGGCGSSCGCGGGCGGGFFFDDCDDDDCD